MTLLISWISETTLRLLALSLLHFLWQGAAVAALAYVVMMLCRSASTRYAVGVGAMALMLAAPVATFVVLQGQDAARGMVKADGTTMASTLTHSNGTTQVHKATAPRSPERDADYFSWLVELWFAGVVLLGLRSAGGILLVERLRRKETVPVANELMELCEKLQKRMGLQRVVRYCESLQLDAPAVAGWIRPVVLLPVSAVSGLTTAQLEAVIAHELAHIARYDAYVNLFQVGVETLLFYHPAVWWMGKRVRAEREHCCDDAAVALCGSPVTYAHALTRMAESKAAPQLAMAANRSPLVERIARLLGANRAADSARGANLSAGVLCLSAALLAGGALLGSVHGLLAQTPAPAPAVAATSVTVPAVRVVEPAPVVAAVRVAPNVHVSVPETKMTVAIPAVQVNLLRPVAVASPKPMVINIPKMSFSYSFANAEVKASVAAAIAGLQQATTAQSGNTAAKESYIDSLDAAGMKDLSADELIGLKVQGVTGEYIKEMRALNLKVDVDSLIGMKVQGVTPEYVKEMRDATGQNLDADELIGMKVQGVTPQYVKAMHDMGVKTDADDIIGMKVQGVTPEYIKEMRDLGMKMDSDDIIGMKVQGVTPEYVKEVRAMGLQADADSIIGMKVQGITPEYVKSFASTGLHPTTDELVGMKVQGVTADYVKALQAEGFKVDVDDVIGAKVQGVTPEFVAQVKSHGFKDLTLEKLITLKQSGVFDAEK